MKYFLSLVIFFCLPFLLQAQTPAPYASVRVSLVGKTIADLVNVGVETEHAAYIPGRSITLVLSARELAQVREAGFQTEVLIPDLTKHYLENQNTPIPVADRGNSCDGSNETIPEYVTPENYSYGSMGGYLTYDEMMAELDKMRAMYPSLISARNITSDTILTWEGRPIYNVKISDNPDVDEAERKVLYTALHHAREPNSASQLIFFMWYLLENYATRTDIQAIVNNLEMYFVPCINVDGYIFNETNNPNGGGFWRKNRRDNGDGSFGVDLNRNYGYFWGDFGGSSPDTYSEIYRGPEAFSEPESRTMRDFCRAKDFLFVLNYHTSGNLFIYPWAYNDSPADSAFIKYGQHFTSENHYHYGTTTETVGYSVNGSSDDWMYGEMGAYSCTPEVGTTGFWPTQGEIDGLNKENIFQNLSVAYSALRYGVTEDLSPAAISSLNGGIPIEFTRYGLLDGPINVYLVPLSSNIISNTASVSFDLPNLSKAPFSLAYQLDPNIQIGEEIVFLLSSDNGLWISEDTLRKVFEAPVNTITTVPFLDPMDNFANWDGNWAITDETFHSAPTCMTDSPNSEYEPQTFKVCEMLNSTSIPANALSANLRFFAKWDIEANYDFVQVTAEGDNNFSQALCGLYTGPGVNSQIDGPVFDGVQADWVEECMDLSDFIGQQVTIRFLFGADGGVEGDGFYFDDLSIEYTTAEVSGEQTLAFGAFRLLQNEPNPTRDRTQVNWKNDGDKLVGKADLLIFNMLGEMVHQQSVDTDVEKGVAVDTRNFAPGLYSYLLRNDQGLSAAMKMTVVR